jgi:hypothetical protein
VFLLDFEERIYYGENASVGWAIDDTICITKFKEYEVK